MHGINKKTVIILQIMLFASTIPKSAPSPKAIVVSARSPAIVVKDEPAISGIAFASAAAIASFGDSPFAFSSENLWQRIMA